MTTARKLFLLLALTICAGSFNAHAQLFDLFGGLDSYNEELAKTMVMYYDSNNKMTKVSAADLRDKWSNSKGISALGNATTNWRMIREFSYQSKPAIVVFREGQAGDGKIGIVEAAFEADPKFMEENDVANLVIYDPNGGKKKDLFATLRIKKYVSSFSSSEYHYDIKEFKIDNDTGNFIIDFLCDEMPYKNASTTKSEMQKTGTVPAPYSTPTQKRK